MAERPKKSLRTKVALGMAGVAFVVANLACGGAPKTYPCDEAFLALQTAFSDSLSGGNMSEKLVEIGPSLLVIATHPDVLINGNTKKWATVVKDIDLNCKDKYSVNYVGAGLKRFTEGVTVRRKSTQNFSLPETNTNGIGAIFLTIAAFLLGLGTLGIGAKKLVGA